MINILDYFKSAPNFTVWYSHPHQKSTVLITAGIDGDEYAGIKAAQYLIDNYKGDIPITVIPIVNIAGYQDKVSFNPLDHQYPKYIFPGSKFGTSSSKLMNKIATIATKHTLWIDLHGGSSNEHLVPFIWTGKSGIKNVDSIITNLLSHLTGRILHEKQTTLPKIPLLAKHGTGYILLESGQLGQIDKESINTHLNWINTILKSLGELPKNKFIPKYNTVVFEKYSNQDTNSKDLLWYSPTIYVSGLYDNISR